MQKLPEVEAAKALMNEAMSWSVMKWLREKKTVRHTADQANALLDQLSADARARWAEGLRSAYDALVAQAADQSGADNRRKQLPSTIDSDAKATAKKIKEADDEVYRCRMDAEKTFDDAERRLSTSMAREGCRKAIHGWELHEKAIRKAEALIRTS
jgi:hypothetical protein